MKKACLVVFCALFVGSYGGYVSPCQAAEPKIDLQALLAKKVPILVEFGSNCCSPCNFSKQLLDDLATSYGGRALVVGADVAVNKDLARQFKIRLTPTQVFFSADGKEFFREGRESATGADNGSFQQDGIGAACRRNQPWSCSRSAGPGAPHWTGIFHNSSKNNL